MYVDRAHRGLGVGTALIEAVVRELSRVGLQRTVLATDDAHEVYARFGFEPLGDGARMWMVRLGGGS